MKYLRNGLYSAILLMMLLASGCQMGTPPATSTATAVPAATTAAKSTAVPVNLAGPPMQVGSTYLYFDGTLLVAVPGGPFTMGRGTPDNPAHTVTLSDFWIYSTKVTNREFQQCVAVGKCTTPDLEANQGYNDPTQQSNPVVGVNWAQGEAYCEYADAELPTEAQWEKAARGPNGNIYPWGNGAPTADLLNYNNTLGATTNVVNYPQGKSYYDALDMEGNVYEWVNDWYDPNYYQTSPAQDPLGPDSGFGGQRSVRSAGYKSNDDQVVAATRYYKLPKNDAPDLGFRCVVKDPTFFAPLCQLTALVGSSSGGNAGSSSGGTCPTVGVTVSYSGCGANTQAIVSFDDSSSSDPNANISGIPSGCISIAAGGHFAKYSCPSVPSSGFSVTISSKCPAAVPPAPTCPTNYKLNNGECTSNGGGTAGQQCPAGTTFDPTNNCCTSTPGTGTSFPACPAGTIFQNIGGMSECGPIGGAGGVAPQTGNVDQQTCPTKTGGGGNPGGSTGGGNCPNGGTYTCINTNYGKICGCK